MNEVFVVLTPETALRVGGIKAKGDYLDTLSYLPGSVLRGALAEWCLHEGQTGQIHALVQRMRFGNLFPSPWKRCYALPFPMTALECKVQGGFREVPREDYGVRGHGVRDSLLASLVYFELEKMGACFPVPMVLRCRECRSRMERVSGFYARLPGGRRKVSAGQVVQTKVALSRRRRAAQERMLYRVVALRPQGVFVGRLWLQDTADLEVLRQAIAKIGVGALTTRGFGAARLEVGDNIRFPSVRERLEVFNEKLRQVWRDLANLARQVRSDVPDKPGSAYFTVDLLAPAILHDQDGLPTLKLLLTLNGKQLRPVYWAAQPAFAGGWSTAWGLPKPTAAAAAMGSVYVFRADEPLEALVPSLEALEASGVGERAGEGLGELLICHPFHLEVHPT